MRPMRFWCAAVGAFAFVASVGSAQESACVICHADEDMVDAASKAIVERFENDVHASVGLSCHDCHGGNPDPTLADDLFASMDPELADNPYVGAPERTEVPTFCGSCHSDPAFMRRFDPDQRVDQEQEYWTSHHGKALREGDDNVATCIDCHGVHGIVPADDTRSPVHPTKVAETCSSCHASAEHMAGYTLADGRELPINQFALWRQSVHAAALLDRGDLSAPTCNDCHGNHGAAPPGLESIAFVCGQCHGREADLFRSSPKSDLLVAHNEYLADAGEEGCAACHEAPEPQASLTDIGPFSECASCHRHHAVIRPSVALLAPLPATPCAFCHETVGPLGEEFPEPPAPSRNYESTRQALLDRAPEGLEGESLFDWLVDEAQSLPTHTAVVEGGERELRPEFERLFTKFRIGKRHFQYQDPATGETREGRVRSCTDCHAPEPVIGDADGAETAAAYLDGMRELTALTARAERILLAARRGGVETREAAAAIDEAVDAQIELEVLVHGFSVGAEGAFAEKQNEGVEHAKSALEAGQAALGELQFRRTGLGVSLAFVALLLIALALRIRTLPRG